ncbi:MAG: hypothetical protein FE834_06935 [Gammaproteobacteria bacterium]|nr:hypothetical protein [Gammaproteobacteria bacterium]
MKNEGKKLPKWMYQALFNYYDETLNSPYPKGCEERLIEVEQGLNELLTVEGIRTINWYSSDD